MDISKYTGYFHDGGILDIQYIGNNLEIFMVSSEVDREEITDPIPLAYNNFFFLRGKLHIEKVKKIKENGIFLINHVLKKNYNNSEIMEFNISKNRVILETLWMNPSDYSVIEVLAEKVWWENIPT